jgi:hypothetical protein
MKPTVAGWVATLGIVALSTLPFLSALHFDLVWDDPLLLAEVGRVAEHDGAAGLFTSDFRLHSERSMGFYRPLTTLSLWVQIRDAWREGGEDALPRAAPWLHAGNLVLHAACSVLVWILLRRVGVAWWASWLAAAIFAVHPVHVEPTVFVSARTDSLAALGVLASLWCGCEGLRAGTARRRWWWFSAGGVFGLLAALAKEQALLLPVFLMLCWCLLRGTYGTARPRLIWVAPWLAGALVALAMRFGLAHVGFGPGKSCRRRGASYRSCAPESPRCFSISSCGSFRGR